MHQRAEGRQIDSGGLRKNTDNEQAQARSRSAQFLHASTPQVHVETARRSYKLQCAQYPVPNLPRKAGARESTLHR